MKFTYTFKTVMKRLEVPNNLDTIPNEDFYIRFSSSLNTYINNIEDIEAGHKFFKSLSDMEVFLKKAFENVQIDEKDPMFNEKIKNEKQIKNIKELEKTSSYVIEAIEFLDKWITN